MDDAARTAALQFAQALAAQYRAHLGERLIGAYALGSLAHGGFSARYSDIDMALVTEDGVEARTLATLHRLAAERDPALGQKLSLFWSDRRFTMGRFPPLDRVDYLDHPVVLIERERAVPPRPPREHIRAYLRGAPFYGWIENAHLFAGIDALAPSEYKALVRTLLYPARLVYSWTTGRMASNDAAVAFTREHPPPGLNTDVLVKALACRQADADPDSLFPERKLLPAQVKSCIRLITRSVSVPGPAPG